MAEEWIAPWDIGGQLSRARHAAGNAAYGVFKGSVNALTGGGWDKAETAIRAVPQAATNTAINTLKGAEGLMNVGKSAMLKPMIDSGYNPYGIKTVDDGIQARLDQEKARNSVGTTAQSYQDALAERSRAFANLRSSFDTQYNTNPYGDAYRQKLWGGAVGQAQNSWVENGRRHGQNLAARGLTNAGPSGLVGNELARFDLKRQVALNQVSNDANLQVDNLANQWNQERARALDNFNLAQAQGSVAAAQAALGGHRLAELLPAEVLAGQIANQGAQMGLDQRAQLFPGQLQAQRQGLEQDRLQGQMLAGEVADAQWDRDNGGLAFARDLTMAAIPGAARAGGAYLASGGNPLAAIQGLLGGTQPPQAPRNAYPPPVSYDLPGYREPWERY